MCILDPFIGWVIQAVLAAGPCPLLVRVGVTTSAQSTGAAAAEIRGLLDDGRYARAEARARELLSQAMLEGRERSLESAELVGLLARAMLSNGEQADPETRRLSELSVTIAVQVAGEPSLAVAQSRLDLGTLCFVLGDHAGARAELEEALAQREKLLGPDHPKVAQVLTFLGYLAYQEHQDIEEAEHLFARARTIEETAPGSDPIDVAYRLSREAIVREVAGDWSGSQRDHERSLAIYEEHLRAGHPAIAREHNNLGSLFLNRCDWPAAALHLEKALAMRRSELGESHVNVASTMALLAQVRGDLGQREEALELWQGSLDRYTQSLGPKDPQLLRPLKALAAELLASGDLDAAEHLLSRAGSILSETGSSPILDLAAVLHLDGQLATSRGDRAAAVEYYRRGLALLEGVPLADAPRTDLFESIGQLLASSDRPDEIEEGIAALQQALVLARALYQDDSPRPTWIQDQLAAVLCLQGRFDEAFAQALAAGAIVREHRRAISARFEERDALGYAARATPGLPLALSIAAHEPAPGRAKSAWDALVRSRSLVVGELALRRRLTALSRDPKLGSLARALVEARERYADLAVRGEADPLHPAWREMLAQLRTDREHAERDLALACSDERVPGGNLDSGLAEVLEALPPGVALVSFVRVDPRGGTPEYVALLWPRGATEPSLRALGDAAAIDDLVARTLAECRLGVREDEYRRVAGELRQRIWDPIELSLAGAREICVVPDGALVLLDLAALPNAEKGYLIERTPPIHYLSTERDLLPEGDNRVGHGLLACGGPDFDRAASAKDSLVLLAMAEPRRSTLAGLSRRGTIAGATQLSELDFSNLTRAASEATRVAALWDRRSMPNGATAALGSQAVVLTGAEATEEAFEDLARGKAVLHLATHGFFLPSAGTSGTRSGRGVPPGALAASPATFDLTLGIEDSLLSGLAFAGANVHPAPVTRKDGLLLAEEICGLDLSGVRLAVLSACDTGLGKVQNGEGVFGLRRAFQVAGVRTLVTSLWPVVDETTEERMLEFYRGWLERGESVAQALRSAALRMLLDRRARGESTHPFHWAGFVAVGGRA